MKFVEIQKGLFVSDPVEPFETDCEHCDNFISSPYTEMGQCHCKEHIACGWGFTCKKFVKK